MGAALGIRPLALGNSLLERFPAAMVSGAVGRREGDLHPALDHGVDEVVLGFGDLDDFFD